MNFFIITEEPKEIERYSVASHPEDTKASLLCGGVKSSAQTKS